MKEVVLSWEKTCWSVWSLSVTPATPCAAGSTNGKLFTHKVHAVAQGSIGFDKAALPTAARTKHIRRKKSASRSCARESNLHRQARAHHRTWTGAITASLHVTRQAVRSRFARGHRQAAIVAARAAAGV